MNKELKKKAGMSDEMLAALKYLIAGSAAGMGIAYGKSRLDPVAQNASSLDVPRATGSMPVLSRVGPERGMLDKLFASPSPPAPKSTPQATKEKAPVGKKDTKKIKKAGIASRLADLPVSGVVSGIAGLGLGTAAGDMLLEKRRATKLNDDLMKHKQMLDDLLLLEQYVVSTNKLPRSLDTVKQACLTKLSAMSIRDLGHEVSKIINAGAITQAVRGLDITIPALAGGGMLLGAHQGYQIASASDKNRQMREKIKATLAERLQKHGPMPVVLRSPRIGATPVPENLRAVAGLSGGRDAIAGI